MIDLLMSHTSVRKYKDVPIPKETVEELVKAGQHAASSHFVQSYSIIYVTDEKKKEQLAELSKNPRQILGAGAVLLFCSDYRRLEKAAAMHDTTIDFGYAENTLVGAIDVALCAQNVAIAAESKGYGICYIGGARNAPAEISDLFDLPKGVMPLFAMTIGVPDQDHEVKPRLPIDAVLHENAYDETRYDTLLPEYDQTMEEYYNKRSSNRKISSWSKQMADFLGTPQRTFMKDALERQGYDNK